MLHGTNLLQAGAITMIAVVLVIALVLLLRLALVPHGQHSKRRIDRRDERASFEDLQLPPWDGRTYPAPRGGYDPDEYREEPE